MSSENSRDLAIRVLRNIEQSPELLDKFAELIKSSAKELSIPDYVFIKKLTLLGSVVKYLKENTGLSYKKIGDLLKRDQRNIWQAYNLSKRKFPSNFSEKESSIRIPVSAIASEKLSVFEAVTAYLKGKGLSFHEIASVVNRNEKTVWTVYQRVKRKNKDG